MRVMCDTNILVRSVISPYGAAAELLTLIAREHALITSYYVLNELYDVLRRPEIRRLHRLTDGQTRRILLRFYKLATLIPLPPIMPISVPKDPKDNPIVVTAIAGRADVLCTLDRHLLDAAATALCAGQGVRVLRDSELLAELRSA